MSDNELAPAGDPRALMSAAALGSIVGVAIGAAYLAGGLARHSVDAALPATSPAPAVFASAPSRPPVLATTAAAPVVVQAPSVQAVVRAPAAPTLHPHPALSLASLIHSAPRAPVVRGDGDLQCLTQAVYYEARGEGAEGQAAVAQVVLNRVRHPSFPKSVCGVVFQHAGGGCQFSFACEGRHGAVETVAWRRARQVAQRALDGAVIAPIGDATHFHATRLGSVWAAGLARVAQIGAHVFYRFSGHGGHAPFHAPDRELAAAPAEKPHVLLASVAQAIAPAAAAATPAAPVIAAPVAAKPAAAVAKVEKADDAKPAAATPAAAPAPAAEIKVASAQTS